MRDELLRFDRAELGEIDLGPGRQLEGQRAARGRSPPAAGARPRERCLDEALHVGMHDAALRAAALNARQIDAELAREAPHRGAGVRLGNRFVTRHARHRPAVGRRQWRHFVGDLGTRGWRRDVRRGRRRRRRLCGCRRRRRGRGGRLGFAAARARLEQQDQRALRHLVAHLQLERLHHPGLGRRNLHRRLVRLQRDQRLFLVDRVAGLDQHLDHFHFLEVPDVGNLHFDRISHGAPGFF